MYKKFSEEDLKEKEKIVTFNLFKAYDNIIEEIGQMIGIKPHIKIDEDENITDIYLSVPFSLKKSELNIKIDRTFEIYNEE